jgi:hypothetical protein
MGWASKSNGELLRLAEQQFDAFLTADQKIPNERNLTTSRIGVMVFAAMSNRLRDIEPLVPKALELLTELRPGTAVVVR